MPSSHLSIDRALLQVVDELVGEFDLDRLGERLRRVLQRLLGGEAVRLGEARLGPPSVRRTGPAEDRVVFTLPTGEERLLEVSVQGRGGDALSAQELVERAHPLLVRMWRSAVEFTVLSRRLDSDLAGDDQLLPAALGRRGLTGRQAEVLIAVAHGRSNRDVAAILGLSERTIQKHLENCYRTLGVSGRSEAASVAWSLATSPRA